jgi:hypothetical protein
VANAAAITKAALPVFGRRTPESFTV